MRKFSISKSTFGFALVFMMFISLTSRAQIVINGNQTANALAQMLTGVGVTVSNATLVCPQNANGNFFVTPPNVSNLGLDSGIVLTSGQAQTTATATGANGPAQGPANSNNAAGDTDLGTLCAQSTFDACILEFDFVPLGDTVKFQYVFGSSEYPSFTCTSFNDVFGFFISGPAITGPYSNNSQNIALVPGSTTCPVGVSTIYCPNSAGCCNTTNFCFGQTPGCGAFNATNNTCAYFVCNAGGATVNYPGFTQVLTAQAIVTPCSTHHLKLAISDAADGTLDSGVFLKAGSLSSNSISFTPISTLSNPYPYIVEGCASGFIKVKRPVPSPLPYTINYLLGGNAINITDYNVSSIPAGSPTGQVTIPANDTIAYIAFSAIQDGLAEGTEEIIIYQLAPCSNNIVDSVSLFISDTIQMNIITPDTAICAEDSVHILVFGDDSLNYAWTPATNITNPNIKEPTVSPNATTDYVVCASLPNSGCAPKCDTIRITINQPPNVFIGNDTIICEGMQIQFNPVISPNQVYTYTWAGTGQTFLSGLNIVNPTGTFNQQGNFTLTLHVEPQAVGCNGDDTMNVQVLPNDIILHNGDTTVCQGATVQINVSGHPLFTYNWTPPTFLNSTTIEDPVSVPDTNITYTVTATFPGCPVMTKSFDIEVQPVPVLDAGPDRTMCDWDTVQMHAVAYPTWYNQYAYTWDPGTGLSNSGIPNPVFNGHATTSYTVIVSTPIGCSDTDNVNVTVYPTEFAVVNPETKTICPRDTVNYVASGGVSYFWTPDLYLSDPNIPNPQAWPNFPIEYTVYSTSSQGCIDTDLVRINVASDAVLDAGDDVTLYPGETVMMNPGGNCSFFNWFPNYHLTATDVRNPVADPPVTTKYILTGTTEFGCPAIDSVTIRISPESILDLPNAFSPGSGTSINDGLRIIKRGLATLSYFRIFNRWGQMVFETTDINEGWDGRFNGKPQPMGVYVYTIDAKTSTGLRVTKQGNVTLIR
ncbi:MAG: choice-of-anchor L domain-containing protein [Chitinophagaceae bacterium]|nr:choice-of-anchor L domain-containing protein [Chitinophagaceae bacterium]